MSTATMSRTDALAKLGELQQEATKLEQDHTVALAKIGNEIAALASSLSDGASFPNAPAAPAANNPVARRRPGRPADPAKKKNTGKSSKVAPNQRNYSNEISLKEAIWDVLDRSPKEWQKSIPDFPSDAEGLKISEIKELIEKEGKWVSSASDISPQLQSHIYNLKNAGKVTRGEGGRYYINEGASLK